MQTATEVTYHTTTTLSIDGQSYSAYLFQSPDDPLFPEVAGTSIFLSRNYQSALKSAPPENMEFWYVRIEHQNELVGMLCFQISEFNPGRSLKNHMHESLYNNVRYRIASLLNMKVLCLGNTLLTGDYGFCFRENIPQRLRTLIMMQTIDWLLGMKTFSHIRMIFVKDFYQDIFKDTPDSPYCKKYHPIETQPSMIMDIPEQWGGLEGYLNSLKSKYRVRAKQAMQLAARLEHVEFSLSEIEANEAVIHELYLKVVEDVGFNLFVLAPGYFAELKRMLGDRFHFWVYRDKGEIISFFTAFEDGDILDAHFLGYDPEVNHHYKLYLNMLLALTGFASAGGFSQLQLSRTATEIKSSVGAAGIGMWAYLRFTNSFFNGWLPTMYRFFKPDMKWVERKPFKVAGRN